MLSTQDRSLLLDSLRPPAGYRLDRALGTTFSLDLLSLLTVPLAFTLFDPDDDEGRPTRDPLALLQAIRGRAHRIHVFCQAGQIDIPSSHRQLYTYLEDSVIEVKAPSPKGVFHPKVWVLRFAAPDQPVLYRLLCLTRNLTFDRSWDTLLALDGELADRTRAIAANRPLADFVAALPGLALRTPSETLLGDVGLLQDELRRVRFELPANFSEYAFWPLGLPGGRIWPFDGPDARIDRMLVLSPFLSPGCLSRLTADGTRHVLVASLEALSALKPASLRPFDQVFALNPDAVLTPAPEAQTLDAGPGAEATADATESPPPPPAARPIPVTGLHAKLFVADAGWGASLWAGSANATNSAFGANVEFLVQLKGMKSAMGVEAILGPAGERGTLRELLVPFEPLVEPTVADAEVEALEAQLTSARRELTEMALRAHVAAGPGDGDFEVRLVAPTSNRPRQLGQVAVHCWPISLAEEAAAVTVTEWAAEVARFPAVSFEALTSFFAFEIVATNGAREVAARFVLNLPLVGAPEGRREQVLRNLLKDRAQVLRFLLMLLAGEDMPVLHDIEPGDGPEGRHGHLLGLESTIFEALLRALDREPSRLDQVAAVVEDLKRAAGGDALLPEGFERVWTPIWEARRSLGA